MIIPLISDLHLEENRPEIANLFMQFLKNCVESARDLYILGDFFEVWIGDDNNSAFNVMIIEALKNATKKGLRIHFLPGNRDFLIGKKFLRASGCQLLPDEQVIDLFGRPTLVMHGDTLSTLDEKYLKFRKKSRNWFFQKLFLIKSLQKRQAIADRYREASKAYTSTTADHIMDVTQSEVLRVMEQYGIQHLIHGHTHRPFVHEFLLNGQSASRTVLGPWHDRGSALICKEDGSQELISFT